MIFGKHINRYYIKYLPLLLLGILSLVAVDLAQMEIPKLYRYMVNGINDGFNEVGGADVAFDLTFLTNSVLLPMLAVIAFLLVGRFVWRICFFGAALETEADLRFRMFDRSKDLSQQFYSVNKVGDLMSLFTNDLETINECFGSGILSFCDALLLGGLSVYRMFAMSPSMTGLSMIPMALMLCMSLLVSRTLTRRWDRRQRAFSALSDFTQENFSGIAVIKAFVKEAKELSAFRRLNRDNEEANVEYVKASTLFNVLVTLFAESVVCVILGYGGYLVYKGIFNAGELVEFIGYFTAIVWPILAISELVDMMSKGKASLARISGFLDTEPDVFDAGEVCDPGEIGGEIEFRNLSFAYPGTQRKVLDNVSFRIEKGESIGLIGRTGSGKTTVVDLILRMYGVDDGVLFIDGHDVNTIPIKAVRDACAYVPQDGFLFSESIGENIAFSLDGYSEEKVVKAAELAEVDGDIRNFSDGYGTVLGERGVTLSGGQKQRVSIARALIKNSQILILDDSVSAVDTATEKDIIESIKRERQGRTTILIAHRISTVEKMDRIIYMSDGRVAAAGTHDELMKTCPEYRHTAELQRLYGEAGI